MLDIKQGETRGGTSGSIRFITSFLIQLPKRGTLNIRLNHFTSCKSALHY